jgi:hypothetical protein
MYTQVTSNPDRLLSDRRTRSRRTSRQSKAAVVKFRLFTVGRFQCLYTHVPKAFPSGTLATSLYISGIGDLPRIPTMNNSTD